MQAYVAATMRNPATVQLFVRLLADAKLRVEDIGQQIHSVFMYAKQQAASEQQTILLAISATAQTADPS